MKGYEYIHLLLSSTLIFFCGEKYLFFNFGLKMKSLFHHYSINMKASLNKIKRTITDDVDHHEFN